MPLQNAVLYYMIKSDKRIKEIRISFIFHFYAGDSENRDYLFGFYSFSPIMFVQVFGKEFSDLFKKTFFQVPIDFIESYSYPVSDNNPVNPVKKPGFLPGRLPYRGNGICI